MKYNKEKLEAVFNLIPAKYIEVIQIKEGHEMLLSAFERFFNKFREFTLLNSNAEYIKATFLSVFYDHKYLLDRAIFYKEQEKELYKLSNYTTQSKRASKGSTMGKNKGIGIQMSLNESTHTDTSNSDTGDAAAYSDNNSDIETDKKGLAEIDKRAYQKFNLSKSVGVSKSDGTSNSKNNSGSTSVSNSTNEAYNLETTIGIDYERALDAIEKNSRLRRDLVNKFLDKFYVMFSSVL